MIQDAINQRYSQLSESSCCLSCGGAINHIEPSQGDVCVDLGSGRGNDVIRMAEKVGPEGHVYGIDLSEGMVAKANANLEKFGITNATIVRSELEKLPLGGRSVDWVVSNCTINHCSDKQAVWNEIYRILKPGGRFVVSDIYAETPIAEEYRNDPEAVAECWAGAITKDEYLEILETAGFQRITILEESTPYEKGKATVCSFTLTGESRKGCCCCG
jgi:ubiquinone/menaquinone biosynthesis C-methylase UbiE